MRKAIKTFFLFLFLCFSAKAQNNFIVAGQHSASDYYYKYIPDSIVINIPGSGSGNHNTQYYSFDINNDGINDFKFTLSPPGTALGGNSEACKISGLDNNKVAFGKYDSCFNFSNVYQYGYSMLHAFQYNDTINANASWDSSLYLRYYSFLMGDHNCAGSFGSDTAYIGVRVQRDAVFEYGWIKIVGIVFNPYNPTTLTMGTFACGNSMTSIDQILEKTYKVIISPNPANNILKVAAGNSKIIIISIYDILGKEILTTREKEIEISKLQEGIYFVSVKTDEGVITKKIIVQR